MRNHPGQVNCVEVMRKSLTGPQRTAPQRGCRRCQRGRAPDPKHLVRPAGPTEAPPPGQARASPSGRPLDAGRRGRRGARESPAEPRVRGQSVLVAGPSLSGGRVCVWGRGGRFESRPTAPRAPGRAPEAPRPGGRDVEEEAEGGGGNVDARAREHGQPAPEAPRPAASRRSESPFRPGNQGGGKRSSKRRPPFVVKPFFERQESAQQAQHPRPPGGRDGGLGQRPRPGPGAAARR